MAGRDPTRPQLEFPALVAELITELRLTGQVGRLNFSDQVIPAFLIGSRGINFGGDLPAFTSAAVFAGDNDTPPSNAIIADTGALPAGTYDLMGDLSLHGAAGAGDGIYRLEHRNAANDGTLATLMNMHVDTVSRDTITRLPLMGYVIGVNERIRAIIGVAVTSGGVSAVIFAQIRPTP